MAGVIDPREATESAVRYINSDKNFKLKYIVPSLFFIGAGAFGSVFRAVTRAKGNPDNPEYPQLLIESLQVISNTRRCNRRSLLDAFRDSSCLDVVAVKFEILSFDEVALNAPGIVNLIREYCLLRRLFLNTTPRYAPVGFPLPIEFSYIGDERLSNDLNTLIITDTTAAHASFKDTYIDNEEFAIVKDPKKATVACYMSMELLGPNLDDWKSFFMNTHGNNGKLFFTMQTTLKLMDQVLCRLIVMHRKNMVHLDLKPDNICMGIGRMTNTAYLVDFGLSKILTDAAPPLSAGSRRYMSTRMFDLQPSNYVMDIESWFYILIVLLTDYIPWSDEALADQLTDQTETGGAREEELGQLVIKTKLAFWGDDGQTSRALFNRVSEKVQQCHGGEVPDAQVIFFDIYDHIKRMRTDFFNVNYTRMHTDIKDEESDLFRRYKTLRKLLLYPYDCDFASSDFFNGDKDLQRRQNERRKKCKMLTYVTGGRDWHWDWDVWYEETLQQSNSSQ